MGFSNLVHIVYTSIQSTFLLAATLQSAFTNVRPSTPRASSCTVNFKYACLLNAVYLALCQGAAVISGTACVKHADEREAEMVRALGLKMMECFSSRPELGNVATTSKHQPCSLVSCTDQRQMNGGLSADVFACF